MYPSSKRPWWQWQMQLRGAWMEGLALHVGAEGAKKTSRSQSGGDMCEKTACSKPLRCKQVKGVLPGGVLQKQQSFKGKGR